MRKRDIKLITLEWYRDIFKAFRGDITHQYNRGMLIAYRNVLQTMGYSYKDLTNKEFVDNKIKELREENDVHNKSKS